MTLPEFFAYIASALLLATFAVRTMIPLRILGISSSLAFLIFGYLEGLLPIVILHVILLPLNVYRFFEMHRLSREMQDAAEGHQKFAALLPFMSGISQPAGTTLFRRGDRASDMYVLTSGLVRLPELDAEIKPGELIGEVGMFSPGGQRMTTAVCSEDCKLQRISRDKVRELVYQNPQIGFHLIGVVTARLLDDLTKLETPEIANGSVAVP